jgi:hypothetical protein
VRDRFRRSPADWFHHLLHPGEVVSGVDPMADKITDRDAITVASLCRRYLVSGGRHRVGVPSDRRTDDPDSEMTPHPIHAAEYVWWQAFGAATSPSSRDRYGRSAAHNLVPASVQPTGSTSPRWLRLSSL